MNKIGVFMITTLWSFLVGAATGDRQESPTIQLKTLGQAPAVLKIVGKDDDVRVYHSDTFEIKYRFYLNPARDFSPETVAALFSKFEVTYKNGILKSKVPASENVLGVGIIYEIGLPSGRGLEVNLDDGDIVVNRALLAGLKVHGADGDVSLRNTEISNPFHIELADGDVTLDHSTLNGKIKIEDGDVSVMAKADAIGEIETRSHQDARVRYEVPGCRVDANRLSCAKGKEKLLISVGDGNVSVHGD